jgi:hypothetical protein
MEAKKPWQSWTLWMNLVMAITAFFPPVQEALKAHPEYGAIAMAAVNWALRIIFTKTAIQLGE